MEVFLFSAASLRLNLPGFRRIIRLHSMLCNKAKEQPDVWNCWCGGTT